MGGVFKGKIVINYSPNFEKVGGAYCFWSVGGCVRALRKHPHMFYTPSFTFLYSRKGEMRGTQNEGLYSGLDYNEKRRCRNLLKL